MSNNNIGGSVVPRRAGGRATVDNLEERDMKATKKITKKNNNTNRKNGRSVRANNARPRKQNAVTRREAVTRYMTAKKLDAERKEVDDILIAGPITGLHVFTKPVAEASSWPAARSCTAGSS